MLNIVFKGFYKREDQLKKIEISKNSVQFKEPKNVNLVMIRGFLLSLPIIISSLIIAGQTLFELDFNNDYIQNNIPFFVFVLGGVIFGSQFVHELIHAAFYPIKAKKEIYISKDLISMFVYCTAPVTKLRFIIIALAPSVILGIVPLFIGVLFSNLLPTPIVCIFVVLGFTTILSAIGDYLNTYNAITQVPKRADVFNNGFHSYWHEREKASSNEEQMSESVLPVMLVSFVSFAFIFVSKKENISLLIFFIIIIISTLNRGLLFSILKWINIGSIIFAYMVMLNLF